MRISDEESIVSVNGSAFVKTRSTSDALVHLLSLYYILDVDWPECSALGLHVLAWLIFDDRRVPPRLMEAVNSAMAGLFALQQS